MYVASEYKTKNHYLTVKKFDEYQDIRQAVKRVKEEAKKCLLNAKQKGLSVKKLISTDVDGTKITLIIDENLAYEFELEYLDGQHVYRQVRGLVPESWLD